MLILAIVALGVPSAINLKQRVTAEVRTQAQAQADLLAASAADLLGRTGRPGLVALVDTAAHSLRARVLVVDSAGRVLVDSAGPEQLGASYRSRPEIRSALSGRPRQVQRSSRTLGQEILATAIPIIRHRRPVGAVRVTQSVSAVNGAVQRAVLALALLGLVVLALGLLAGGVIAAQVVRPIRRLEQMARRVARGDLLARAPLEGSREQRSLAASFNEMTERLSGLLDSQRDFVADASHQLRTPLTGLRLQLEEAQALSAGPAKKQMSTAITEVDRLSHTVDELLALTAAGVYQASAAPLNLDELAASAAHRWKSKAAETGTVFDQRRGGGSYAVYGSMADIERALDALIENAIQYSSAASTVTLATAPGSIEVRDRGPGVAEEERELVFERFQRGRAGRAGPAGSGLGLAIARELVRKWGGDIELYPPDGGGTVARLTLPEIGSEGTPSGENALPALNRPPTSLDS